MQCAPHLFLAVFSENFCMQWVPLFVPIKCIPTYLIFFNDSNFKHYRGHGTSNKAICCARHKIWISNHWHVGICIVPPFKDLIPRNKCNIMRSAIQSKNRILTLSWQFWWGFWYFVFSTLYNWSYKPHSIIHQHALSFSLELSHQRGHKKGGQRKTRICPDTRWNVDNKF